MFYGKTIAPPYYYFKRAALTRTHGDDNYWIAAFATLLDIKITQK